MLCEHLVEDNEHACWFQQKVWGFFRQLHLNLTSQNLCDLSAHAAANKRVNSQVMSSSAWAHGRSSLLHTRQLPYT